MKTEDIFCDNCGSTVASDLGWAILCRQCWCLITGRDSGAVAVTQKGKTQ